MQLQKVVFVVTGLRRFKGEVENQKHDFTKAFVEVDMTEGDNSRGTASQEFALGDSSVYDKLLSYPLPFQAEFAVSLSTNGKRTQTNLKFLQVVSHQPKKAA